ncbi:VOC family protein [Flavobacterium sp.]|uniref:VOC family protein n=1 Tax=Flavobacterium sp. TaxID=239 RepID=UPI002633692D|nr:VOC family protein [Flavobacterium sp.]
MHQYLSGVQQIGIGVTDVEKAMHTYKHLFGMDVLIFDDVAPASLMTQYTGNQVYNRRAILTMNLKGGGGLELWQFLNRTPQVTTEVKLGDLGISAAIIKTDSLEKSHKRLSEIENISVSEIVNCESGASYIWVNDGQNDFKIIPQNDWFQSSTYDVGGIIGAVIGVSNMETSLHFYQQVLGFETVLYDIQTSDNGREFRKIGLQKTATGKGAFNKLLGNVVIELVQILNEVPKKIFSNRFWGDCGFIHLCFDVLDMDALKLHAEKNNYHFSVDSNNSFAMDNASGRFCYIEDPDGTLIELVETHKVPIMKKLGWYLDLTKRNREKPLPNWMIKMLALSKVK